MRLHQEARWTDDPPGIFSDGLRPGLVFVRWNFPGTFLFDGCPPDFFPIISPRDFFKGVRPGMFCSSEFHQDFCSDGFPPGFFRWISIGTFVDVFPPGFCSMDFHRDFFSMDFHPEVFFQLIYTKTAFSDGFQPVRFFNGFPRGLFIFNGIPQGLFFRLISTVFFSLGMCF